MIIIYKLTAPNGKSYVGQTSNIINRFYLYSSYNCKNQVKLYRSLVKYKWNNFTKEILEYLPDELSDEYERFYIKRLKCCSRSGLNCQSGGNKNKHHSDESKKKMSKQRLSKKIVAKRAFLKTYIKQQRLRINKNST